MRPASPQEFTSRQSRPRHVQRRAQYREYDPQIDPMLARWAAQRNLALDHAARQMGIPTWLLRQWIKQHPELAAAMSEGERVADAKVVEALHKLALGYEYNEAQAEISEKSKDGRKEKRKRSKRHKASDYRAIALWLKTRQPEIWGDKFKSLPPKEIIARIRPIQLPSKPKD